MIGRATQRVALKTTYGRELSDINAHSFTRVVQFVTSVSGDE
jgi:hypothetical protein